MLANSSGDSIASPLYRGEPETSFPKDLILRDFPLPSQTVTIPLYPDLAALVDNDFELVAIINQIHYGGGKLTLRQIRNKTLSDKSSQILRKKLRYLVNKKLLKVTKSYLYNCRMWQVTDKVKTNTINPLAYIEGIDIHSTRCPVTAAVLNKFRHMAIITAHF